MGHGNHFLLGLIPGKCKSPRQMCASLALPPPSRDLFGVSAAAGSTSLRSTPAAVPAERRQSTTLKRKGGKCNNLPQVRQDSWISSSPILQHPHTCKVRPPLSPFLQLTTREYHTSTVFILCLYEIYSPRNQLLIQAAAKILLLGNNERLPVAYKPQVTVKHKILKTCCHCLPLYTFSSFRDTRVVLVSMLIYDGLCYAAPI